MLNRNDLIVIFGLCYIVDMISEDGHAAGSQYVYDKDSKKFERVGDVVELGLESAEYEVVTAEAVKARFAVSGKELQVQEGAADAQKVEGAQEQVEPELKCNVCGKPYKNAIALAKHLEKEHTHVPVQTPGDDAQ